MDFPTGLHYTKDHEWAKAATDGTITVGLTDHAQEALGEIVYVELPAVGKKLNEHDTFGVVESIKAVSDCYSPAAGEIVGINKAVSDEPAIINRSPYGDGWLIKIKLADKGALSKLMSTDDYKKYVDSLK
jgi:glycine cleavage system H protein